MTTPHPWLDAEEVAELTGRKRTSAQIEALRAMGIAFYINAIGRPVVARSVFEARALATEPQRTDQDSAWAPNVLKLPTRRLGHGSQTNRQSQPAKGHARQA